MKNLSTWLTISTLVGASAIAACGDSGEVGGAGGEGDTTGVGSSKAAGSTKASGATSNASSAVSNVSSAVSNVSTAVSTAVSSNVSTVVASSSDASTAVSSNAVSTAVSSNVSTVAVSTAGVTTSASSSSGGGGCTPATWVFSEKLVGNGGAAIRGDLVGGLGGPEVDVLNFEFYGDATGVIDLGAAPNDNYATCLQCARLFQDSGAPAEASFFQVSGTIDIDAASTPTAGDITFQATNLVLTEVTIDPGTFVSTPVPNGRCVEVAMAGGSFPAVPPTNDTCAAPAALLTSTVGTWLDASDDYQPGGFQNTCTGFPAGGPDVAYSFTLAAGETLEVTVTPDLDADVSLYVVSDCAQEEATCQEGADVGGGGDPDTLTFTSVAGGTYFLIVDQYVELNGPIFEGFTIESTIN